MIHLFAAALSPLLQALPWVERWGGVAFPLQAEGSYTDPGTGMEVSVRQTYPVSCAVGADCGDAGFYTRLLPDDRYTSVAWMEALGGFSYAEERQGYAQARQRVRVIFWLNMQRLGALDCGGSLPYLLSALQALPTGRQWSVSLPGLSVPVAVAVRDVSGVPPAPASVFGAYTFAVQPRLFLHPYSFFALDVEMKATLPLGCFCLPPGEAVECLEVW